MILTAMGFRVGGSDPEKTGPDPPEPIRVEKEAVARRREEKGNSGRGGFGSESEEGVVRFGFRRRRRRRRKEMKERKKRVQVGGCGSPETAVDGGDVGWRRRDGMVVVGEVLWELELGIRFENDGGVLL